jgi:hypothetical protein
VKDSFLFQGKGQEGNARRVLVLKPEGKRPRHRRQNEIKMISKKLDGMT